MPQQKIMVGCRLPDDQLNEIDIAANEMGMSRTEWIRTSILKALGKRPRHTIASRLAKLEQRLKHLESAAIDPIKADEHLSKEESYQ